MGSDHEQRLALNWPPVLGSVVAAAAVALAAGLLLPTIPARHHPAEAPTRAQHPGAESTPVPKRDSRAIHRELHALERLWEGRKKCDDVRPSIASGIAVGDTFRLPDSPSMTNPARTLYCCLLHERNFAAVSLNWSLGSRGPSQPSTD